MTASTGVRPGRLAFARQMIHAPPQPSDDDGCWDADLMPTADAGPSIGPLLAQPLPQFPAVLPRPPSGASRVSAPASQEGTLDGQWMSEAWRSVKGMERKWERLRQARGSAVSSALDQATAVISEVGAPWPPALLAGAAVKEERLAGRADPARA